MFQAKHYFFQTVSCDIFELSSYRMPDAFAKRMFVVFLRWSCGTTFEKRRQTFNLPASFGFVCVVGIADQ